MDRSSYRSNTLSSEEWAAIWLRQSREKREEDFWAWEELTWTVIDDPERAWPVILQLVEQAVDADLEFIGAGPIEHLVEYHGTAFIDRIESTAASNERFREALATIWLNKWKQDPEVVTRTVAASGGVIEPFYLNHDEAEREEKLRQDGA